jgi:hypothetical protein
MAVRSTKYVLFQLLGKQNSARLGAGETRLVQTPRLEESSDVCEG